MIRAVGEIISQNLKEKKFGFSQERVNKKYIILVGVSGILGVLLNSFLTLYLIEKGLSFSQIGLLFSVYLGTTAVLDYPTGGLADKYGRRNIYIVGKLFTSLSYFILFFGISFPALIFSYILKGIGSSQLSGSLITWLGDTENKVVYKNTLLRTKLISSIIKLIVPIVFIYLKLKNIGYLILLTAVVDIITSIFVIIFFKENYGSSDKLRKTYMNVIRFTFKDDKLRYIIWINIAIYTFFTIFIFVWQPIAKDILGDIKYIPILFGIYSISLSLGSYFIKLFHEDTEKISLFIFCNMALSFIFFRISNTVQNIVLLVSALIFFGLGSGLAYIYEFNVY
ncbi:MFS transporter [Fusobacteria bacterium ZRK30]|nr:MFS transporter [Fusobacteria bacterium ZRK30]